MNDITNRTIFTTMLIIGVITIGLLIAQRQQAVSYAYPTTYSNNLGASAYDANSYSDTNLNVRLPRAGYVPVVYTNYPVSAYRTSNTRTVTSYSSAPKTTKTYYTTSYLPNESGYNGSYYSSGDQGYVPAGCESGTDYSLTTGEPCG